LVHTAVDDDVVTTKLRTGIPDTYATPVVLTINTEALG